MYEQTKKLNYLFETVELLARGSIVYCVYTSISFYILNAPAVFYMSLSFGMIRALHNYFNSGSSHLTFEDL